MASFTIKTGYIPDGTTVSAYPTANWPQALRPPTVGSAPQGSATATAVTASGAATFTGLADGTHYYAYDAVSTSYRSFRTDPLSSSVAYSTVAYGDPMVAQVVNVTNVAATILSKDTTRSRVDFLNVSDTEITVAPVASGLVAGQGLLLEPNPPKLATPGQPTGTGAITGGTLTAAGGPYAYRVTALDSRGETLPGTESATIAVASGTTGTVTLSWPSVPGATSYRVYGRTAGAEQYLAATTAPSYVDTGAVTPSGAMPSVNTTGLPATTQPPATFYTNCAWQAIHAATGSKGLYVATWGP